MDVSCPDPDVSHLERHCYLFGYPIAHSMSPRLHQSIYDALGLRWGQQYLPSLDMAQFLRLIKHPKCFGSAVTMPHKMAVMEHLDELTQECVKVGACNTVYRRGSRLIGTNTDTVGVRESFYQNVSDPDQIFHGRPGLVLGGGGAARSAVYALIHSMKCTGVYLVNRDVKEVTALIDWCKSQGYGDDLIHVRTPEQAASLPGAGAIVACIPNFTPATAEEMEARAVFQAFLSKTHKGAMLEMCYHPIVRTEIFILAETAGWQVIMGTEAVIYQGIEQDILWTGVDRADMPVQAAKDGMARALAQSLAHKL
ncbi:shikimate/quinate 5-dehydrogenase [Piedraia hortae CBS 480.64]|uniref:Shikimate/quinate 5-dehydrogenase n=1 Tax=Piedraia hortae CBS 480.64 TaxID=1314780 RepID=A0A6A7C8S2_9PEZI|nr:shikimate/quinate 5-dehydrogenase [Piedraia hortae CBS 480.64]